MTQNWLQKKNKIHDLADKSDSCYKYDYVNNHYFITFFWKRNTSLYVFWFYCNAMQHMLFGSCGMLRAGRQEKKEDALLTY